ncbi:MAG: transposase [Verrucomicrobia bacterium]|nr:transposase [Verrucomicrobiota bacterium]MCH8510095.1 transposase [Kiritimatiellia bacterium]
MSAYLTTENFRSFDPEKITRISYRNLPHWDQKDTCAFVTFRLNDSLPHSAKEDFERKKRFWLTRHGWPTSLGEAEILDRLSPLEKRRFQRFACSRFHRILDKGLGSCVLRDEKIREILIEIFHYAAGERYLLGNYVIMPNHVHILLQPCNGASLKACLGSIRHYSAREINKSLNRKGALWQAEPFDHLVRSVSFFKKYQRYIRINPVCAKLQAEDFTIWAP